MAGGPSEAAELSEEPSRCATPWHNHAMGLGLVRTLAAVAVPIVVAVIGYWLSQRIKRYEASQWRDQELIKARLQYYGQIASAAGSAVCKRFREIRRGYRGQSHDGIAAQRYSWRDAAPPDAVMVAVGGQSVDCARKRRAMADFPSPGVANLTSWSHHTR